ncbi:MAG: EAL domain-containing protein [Pseudomonadota bacterium]
MVDRRSSSSERAVAGLSMVPLDSPRAEALESENRQHMFSLDLLAELCDVHRCPENVRGTDDILQALYQCIAPLVRIKECSFFLVDDDATFRQQASWPNDAPSLQSEVDALILSGDFAWAINQSGPVSFRSKTSRHDVMLGVLATRNHVHGMFVALLERYPIDRYTRKVVAVALSNCAYAIENSALYTTVSDQRDNYARLVDVRTRDAQFSADHDLLTGLYNRRAMMEYLAELAGRDQHIPFCFILVDIGSLSRVNNSYGFRFGDLLLTEVSLRLRRYFKEAGAKRALISDWQAVQLGRMGAGAFGVCIPLDGELDEDAQTELLDGLLLDLRKGYSVESKSVTVSASAGTALFPTHGTESAALIDCAEIALHHARQSGSRHCSVFHPGMRDQRETSDFALERELNQAIESNQFFICYQPKVDLLSEEIIGAEALLRWRHPLRGLIPPSKFIPIAENCHLIEAIGTWVLSGVCKQIREWELAGMTGKKYSVNLSQVQIQQGGLAEQFTRLIEDTHLGADRLELEVTETSLTRDVEGAIEVLTQLHRAGFALSLDDFGTGHSSLTLLKKFPLDTIKIDRSFVRDLNSDPDDAAIVNAVVTMGHNLRMRVIAEGVETREQLHFLRSMGCHEVQGYYVARPMLPVEFAGFVANWKGLKVS